MEAINVDGELLFKPYNSWDYGDYIEIQLNKGGKWKLYYKTGGEAIKFDGIDEFYCSRDYGDGIEIQFNEGDKFQLYHKT